MRILQVSPRYCPDIGGVEECVKNISERIAERHDLTVATTDPTGRLPKEETINGVRVLRFKSWAPGEAYYFSNELQQYLKNNSDHYHLVHAHGYHAFPAFYAMRAKASNKYIISPHYHGTGHSFLRKLLFAPYKYLGRKIFEKADQVICVSNHEQNLLLKHFKINPIKTCVIPNGIALEEFRGVAKRKKPHRTILSVSRLEKYKGIQNVIQAMTSLDEDVVLNIIGTGPFEKNLAKLSAQLHLQNRVVFSKNLERSDLIQRYADADLFILLSNHEAYGISIAEALASRTPCITANCSALSEWIDSKTVFGVNYPIDLNELVGCIKNVIGKTITNPALHDWNEMAKKTLTLYECVGAK